MTIHIYFMVAGPQTPHVYHFSTRVLAVGRATDAPKCLKNKTGMKKRKASGNEHKKKKLWKPRRKTAVLVCVCPSELLNNFTLIKDNSKSMCCCELLFMTKGPGQCCLTWFIWLLWVPINERSDWPSEQLDRMSLHSLPLISCYLRGEMSNRSLRQTHRKPHTLQTYPWS